MSDGGKMRGDIAWNVGSLAILGVAGIAQNIVILASYDAAVLGAFNQVFALYIFFSQFAVGGIHLSVLKQCSEHSEKDEELRSIICSGLVPTFGLSAAASLVFVALRGTAASLLESPDVATGMMVAAPGLFLFSLNKVLLAVLNAERRMKEFAFFQALRPISFIVSLLVMARLDLPGGVLPFMFTVAEGVLFVGLAAAVFSRLCGFAKAVTRSWMREHLRFGGKSFLSGVLGELNTRVDVLMLGWFMSDRIVGIYSFAAMVAEGFFQLLVIVRNNFNPILIRLLAAEDRSEFSAFVKRGKRQTWLWIGAVGLVSILLYPLAVKVVIMLGISADLGGSWPVFALIVAGVMLAAGYLPFMFLLANAGLPGWHTILILGSVMFNAVANALLIPAWGANGAAAATGVSFVFSVLLLRWMTSRLLGIRL